VRAFHDFAGNHRFEVLTRLGQGGMGAVYQVIDRSRNVRVALKSVGEVSGEGLLRFKREYRAVSAIRHPNLVELGELFEMDQRWFFTMELIDGVDFYSYVRGDGAANDNAQPPVQEAGPDPLKGRALAPSSAGFSEARLRRALAGLVSGVAALHAKGMLHRDVKPGNVLVSDEGRVVLIDFGLVTGLDRVKQMAEISMVGTVPYMSPEQAAQELLGPASDWYSVGVMLYECLTGRLPIDDAPLRLAMRKQLEVPPSPRSLVPDVPADLDALCVALLAIDPRKRPSVQEIHRRLHVDAHGLDLRPSTNLSVASLPEPFVGRSGELGQLARALADTLGGRQRSVCVRGPSGIGKSALLRQFQTDLEASAPDTLVLSGRCQEPRTVRYGALAGIMDGLGKWLKACPADFVSTLLPADISLIASTFQVLERVPAVSQAPRARAAEDPQEKRRALAAGVRELLRRIAERFRTVVLLDDMQWSDEDSFHLLRELTRAPDAPPLLLVYAAQTAWDGTSERRRMSPDADDAIVLGPLAGAECRELVRRLGAGAAEEVAQPILAEAEGQPYLLEALVHDRSDEAVAHGALERLLASLGPASRSLLEVIALAGAPITKRLAAEAAGIPPDDAHAELRSLRAVRWVRSEGPLVSDRVALAHDRVRQSVLAAMSFERRESLHRAIASVLDEARAEPDLLAHHYLRGGDRRQADQQLRKAVQRALSALAFDHAAALLEQRIELGGHGTEEERDLSIAHGDALASAGRGLEAAAAYASASARSSGTLAVDLQRRMAEQYLLGGRYDDGMKACAQFLAAFGSEFPATPRSALLQLVMLRARIALRGHGFKARQPEQVAQEELAHIDALWSMAKSLATHDVIRGQLFQSRGLLRALAAGEPSRVSRALSAEYVTVVVRSPERHKQAEELLVRAVELARELGSPYALALTHYCRGLGEFAGLCRFAEALDSMAQSLAILRSECRDVGWEMCQSVIISTRCRMLLGDWRALRDVSHECQQAAARGDVYLGLVLRGQVLSFLDLVDDRAAEAAAGVEEAFRPIERAPSPLNRFLRELAELKVLLYRGQAAQALAAAATHRKGLVDTLLLSAPVLRLMGNEAALLSVLLAIEQKLDVKVRLKEAASIVSKLERDPAGATGPSSQLGRAAIAHAQGHTQRALAWLERAEVGFAAHHRDPDTAAVRRRRGQLIGGEEGRAIVLAAERWFASQGTRNVPAMCRLLAPGFAGLDAAEGP
jgi:serine/threonine protein kinase/tetratricopeptide (TPR) repeat protein